MTVRGGFSSEKLIDCILINLFFHVLLQNFTDVGYKKIRAPEHIYKIITEFWEANKDNESNEDWRDGNSFVNYWENPSTMVSVENSTLIGGGAELHDTIWNVTKDLISAWTGQELEGSSLYGIRIYKEGAILAPHVDRLPLISSAIINVAQDVDEEWPLEVFGHDGVVRNVTMQPGDMVLYESHSVIHGKSCYLSIYLLYLQCIALFDIHETFNSHFKILHCTRIGRPFALKVSCF